MSIPPNANNKKASCMHTRMPQMAVQIKKGSTRTGTCARCSFQSMTCDPCDAIVESPTQARRRMSISKQLVSDVYRSRGMSVPSSRSLHELTVGHRTLHRAGQCERASEAKTRSSVHYEPAWCVFLTHHQAHCGLKLFILTLRCRPC